MKYRIIKDGNDMYRIQRFINRVGWKEIKNGKFCTLQFAEQKIEWLINDVKYTVVKEVEVEENGNKSS